MLDSKKEKKREQVSKSIKASKNGKKSRSISRGDVKKSMKLLVADD